MSSHFVVYSHVSHSRQSVSKSLSRVVDGNSRVLWRVLDGNSPELWRVLDGGIPQFNACWATLFKCLLQQQRLQDRVQLFSDILQQHLQHLSTLIIILQQHMKQLSILSSSAGSSCQHWLSFSSSTCSSCQHSPAAPAAAVNILQQRLQQLSTFSSSACSSCQHSPAVPAAVVNVVAAVANICQHLSPATFSRPRKTIRLNCWLGYILFGLFST